MDAGLVMTRWVMTGWVMTQLATAVSKTTVRWWLCFICDDCISDGSVTFSRDADAGDDMLVMTE
jgi:hypothetical protein